jgi:ribA/ribD-fused uncharacterized protein
MISPPRVAFDACNEPASDRPTEPFEQFAYLHRREGIRRIVALVALPLDLDALRAAVTAGDVFGYHTFWGHRAEPDGVFSQWWPSRFAVDGVAYDTAEQFMMAGKARLFADDGAHRAILAEPDPARCKSLGRKIRGFDEARWTAARFDLVTQGNVAKFHQSERLRAILLATGDAILVEASPTDRIWGIGMAASDPRVTDPRAWTGLNLLGFALVRARAILRGET